MKTIWKYALESNSQTIYMPAGAEILTVQSQYGTPVMWALVDPEAPTEPRKFVVYGTGYPAPETGQYLGTFQIENGRLVFHVFEVIAANNSVFTAKFKSPCNPHGWPFELSNGRAKLELKYSFSSDSAIYVDELRDEHELVSSRAGKWLVEL